MSTVHQWSVCAHQRQARCAGVPAKRVAIYISEDCLSTDIAAIGEALQIANKLQAVARGGPSYVLSLLSLRGGGVASSSFIKLSKSALGKR
jgi:hypothetical protein